VYIFYYFLGYWGIVHPPSADEGTERTWFEPWVDISPVTQQTKKELSTI